MTRDARRGWSSSAIETSTPGAAAIGHGVVEGLVSVIQRAHALLEVDPEGNALEPDYALRDRLELLSIREQLRSAAEWLYDLADAVDNVAGYGDPADLAVRGGVQDDEYRSFVSSHPEAAYRIAAQWGPKALQALVRNLDLNDSILPEVRVESSGPFRWVEVKDRAVMPSITTFAIYRLGSFHVDPEPEFTIDTLCSGASWDVVGRLEELIVAFCTIARREVVAGEAVERVMEAMRENSIDQRLLAYIHAPRVRRGTLEFCTYLSHDGAVEHVSVDTEARRASIVRVGTGEQPPPLMGRAYRDATRLVLAPLVSATQSSDRRFATYRAYVPSHEARAIAASWRAAARAEHASVASFSRTALELMAVGAPLELVRRVHQAAIDEADHARLCLDLAASLDGESFALGALEVLPLRTLDVEGILRTTLDEALVPEFYASATALSAAARCNDPIVRERIHQLGDDEYEHACLAMETVRWCLSHRPDLGPLVARATLHPPDSLVAGTSGAGVLTREELIDVEATTKVQLQQYIQDTLESVARPPGPPHRSADVM